MIPIRLPYTACYQHVLLFSVEKYYSIKTKDITVLFLNLCSSLKTSGWNLTKLFASSAEMLEIIYKVLNNISLYLHM
jgi:hypothetical protein